MTRQVVKQLAKIVTVEPVYIMDIDTLVIPPEFPGLDKSVVEPVILDVVEARLPPPVVVKPVILEKVFVESTSDLGLVFSFRTTLTPDNLVVQTPFLEDIDKLVEYDEKAIDVLKTKWSKIFKPIEKIETIETVSVPPALPKYIDGLTKVYGIRIRVTGLPPDEAEEILSTEFYKEYRITRILKRMEIVVDLKPFIELYQSMRRFEREKKIDKLRRLRRRRY